MWACYKRENNFYLHNTLSPCETYQMTFLRNLHLNPWTIEHCIVIKFNTSFVVPDRWEEMGEFRLGVCSKHLRHYNAALGDHAIVRAVYLK